MMMTLKRTRIRRIAVLENERDKQPDRLSVDKERKAISRSGLLTTKVRTPTVSLVRGIGLA
jgi:hypothetical protein